ncbi:MAG: hypothetical protein SGBAC_011150 [Bacillariaceae sp.]
MACQRDRDLLQAMEDEAFVDTILLGSDSLEVPCNKFVLGLRSPIFKKMFFAGAQEQQRAPLNYPSVVLKVIVKYCYSDEVDLGLLCVGEAETFTDQEAITLVQLRDAARYFELYHVANYIEKEIGESVFQDKESGCVCAILSELMHRIDDEGPFWDMLLQVVIQKPKECLLPNCPSEANQGAMGCHPRLLAKLLGKVVDKYVVVKCLERWFDDACIEEECNANLVEVSNGVNLKDLSPFQLSTIEPSPLFPMARIYEALVHQCQRAKAQEPQVISTVVYVSGAGGKGVDGYYYQYSPMFGSTSDTYYKEGIHGGVACHFEVKWRLVDSTWAIYMVPKENGSVPLILYEAGATGTVQLPFKFWECVEGAEPAPLVAMIESGSPLPNLFPKQLPNHLPKPQSRSEPSVFSLGSKARYQRKTPRRRGTGKRTRRLKTGSQQAHPTHPTHPIQPTQPTSVNEPFGGISQPIRFGGSPTELTKGAEFRPTPFAEDSATIMLMAITAMQEHKDKSFEELRLEDFNRRRISPFSIPFDWN